jgi:hypothetical protein
MERPGQEMSPARSQSRAAAAEQQQQQPPSPQIPAEKNGGDLGAQEPAKIAPQYGRVNALAVTRFGKGICGARN